MMPVGQIYGEETLNVSIWGGLDSIIGLPMIIRESIDSAGKVWFGSFWAARIGCLDPSTNEVKMWIVPETSGVQTVSVDYADKVWLTALSRIGRFDPSTNFFTVWPITGVSYWTGVEPFAFPLVSLDSHGDAFFPELDTNKIGRINPATNELTEWVIPTSDSKPGYTMVDANGNVWFAELAGNKIGRLNPYTNEITEWNIPTPGSGPSGLHVAGGLVYFAEYHSNKIGRLNPSTNEMTQWSISIYSAYGPYGLFVDSSGDAWFTALYWRGTYEAPGNYLCRLGIDNILTCWTPELLISSYGVTVDTKMNVGDVYVSGWYVGSYAVLRFRPATP
jgi:virginiamycin B lyase